MAEVLAVRATITKIFEGYSLTLVVRETARSRLLIDKRAASVSLVVRESARSRLLIDKRAASVFEAEAAAESFTALHRIPWHTVEVLYR